MDGIDAVTVTWRTRDDDNIQFASPPTGPITIPAESWTAAVRRLDRELMTAMRQRIDALAPGGPHAREIDTHGLYTEHQVRETSLA